MVDFVELDKVSHCQAGMTAATRGALSLMERGFCRFAPSNWDDQAFCAMVGAECFKPSEPSRTVDVSLAWIDPTHRKGAVLAALLQRLRAKYAGSEFTHIHFTYHDGNADMAEAARKLRAEVWTHSARVKL
jgi:hypothetical protein